MNTHDFVYRECQKLGFKYGLSERDSNSIAAQSLSDYKKSKKKAVDIFKDAEILTKGKAKCLKLKKS